MLVPVPAYDFLGPSMGPRSDPFILCGPHRVLHMLACTYLLGIGANAADEEGLGLAQCLQQFVKRCLEEEGMHMGLLTRRMAHWGRPGHHCCMKLTNSFEAPAVGAPWLTKDSFGVGDYTAGILLG